MGRFAVIVIMIFAMNALAVVHPVTVVPGTTFSPITVIAAPGDTVRWTNMGGFHNVAHAGFPQLFRNGDPSSGTWVFSYRIPDTTGITALPYVCEAHLDQGMAGTITVVPSSADDGAIPTAFRVGDVYPNPFNATANLEVVLPQTTQLTAEIYNFVGQKVATLFSGTAGAGTHVLPIDGSQWSSGIYIARIQAMNRETFRKLVLMK
ncbi:T9SS type A sorting domain-containing protein [bacterium]|nr:T9SS type A sorting domain-containing protein [bacterium]